MIGRAATAWPACARCAHGDARGEICSLRGQALAQPTAVERSPLGRCGPDAAQHVYRAPAPEAPPLLAAA